MGLSSPDIPSRNGSQPSPEGGPDAQTLLGPSASTKPVDLQETLRATMAQFRQIEDSVTAIARQFPESSEASRAVISGLRKMMMAATQKLTRGQEGPPTPVLG